MTDITLRQVKGAPLTYDELDANFANLKETADLAYDAVAGVGGKANASALGTDADATDLGSFTGDNVPDGSTAKEAIQALSDALDTTSGDAATKTNATAIGIAATDADMGTPVSGVYTPNGTAKDWFEEAGAAIEEISDDSNSAKGAAKVGYKAALTGAIGRTQRDRNQDTVSVKDFGAKADYIRITGASISSGSDALTSPNNTFTVADVGKSIIINGAGAAGTPLETTIASYVSATSVTLSTNAATTVTSTATGGYGTNNKSAFESAFAASVSVSIPRGPYYFASGLTIPVNISVGSDSGPIMGANGVGGAVSFGGVQLVFANSVAKCVQMGEAGNASGALRGFSIIREGETSPAGSIALEISGLENPVVEDIAVYNHAIAYRFAGSGTASGIAAWVTRLFSGRITDAHLVLHGWPEFRAVQCRFGMNGAIDVNSNAYVRISGGGSGSGSGPNTIVFTNCHFNQGNSGVVDKLIEIKDITQFLNAVSEIKLTDCYAENFNYGITTDSTCVSLRRVGLKGCTFNATGGLTSPSFLSLNAATVINEWQIVGNLFFGSDFTISSRTINGLSLVGNRFGLPVSITASALSNSTAALAGNAYLNGGLTVAGSTGWAMLSVSDVFQSGSTITNTAGPAKYVNIVVPNQSIQSWTPALNFGGGSTGIAYDIQSGAYQVVGNIAMCQFRIKLTNKGSSTGAATVANLPIPMNSSLFQTGGGGNVTGSNALSSISGPIVTAIGTGIIRLYQQGATSTASLTDANFTNTSEISGHVVYFT